VNIEEKLISKEFSLGKRVSGRISLKVRIEIWRKEVIV